MKTAQKVNTASHEGKRTERSYPNSSLMGIWPKLGPGAEPTLNANYEQSVWGETAVNRPPAGTPLLADSPANNKA